MACGISWARDQTHTAAVITYFFSTYGDDLSLGSLMKNVSIHKAVFILLRNISISKHNMMVYFPLSIKAFNFRSCQIFLFEVLARWGHLVCWPQLLLSLLISWSSENSKNTNIILSIPIAHKILYLPYQKTEPFEVWGETNYIAESWEKL